MAGREFTVKGTITTDTKSAERNTRALAKAQEELGAKIDALRAKYDAGEISAERFLRQQTALERQQARLAGSLGGAAASADAGALSLGRLTAAAAGIASGVGGVLLLERGLRAAVTASAEQEEATNRLRVALGELGTEADGVVKALEAQAEQLQNTTAFADDAVLSAQARIAAFVNEEAAIKLLTTAAADLAAARNIDLVKASGLLVRSFTTETNALKRLGIEVDGAAGSSERLRSVIEGVANVAGGQAAAQLDTATGAFGRLKNAAGEVLEAIGDFGTKSDTVRNAIDTLTTVLFIGADALGGLTGASDDAAAAQDRQAAATQRQAAALEAARAGLAQLSLESDKARAAFDALAEAQNRDIEASDRFVEGLNRLNIRLGDDLAQEIQRNNEFLAQMVQLHQSGEASASDLARAQEAVAKANAKLSAEMRGANTETAAYATSTAAAARATRDVAAASDLATPRVATMREGIRLTAREFDALTRNVLSYRDAIELALQSGAQLVNQGTRIRLAGGGSRLTSEPGLGASRRQSRFVAGLDTIA